MLNIKNLTITMLLAGVSALSFAQAQAPTAKGTSTASPAADAGAEKPNVKPKKTKKKRKDASAHDPNPGDTATK